MNSRVPLVSSEIVRLDRKITRVADANALWRGWAQVAACAGARRCRWAQVHVDAVQVHVDAVQVLAGVGGRRCMWTRCRCSQVNVDAVQVGPGDRRCRWAQVHVDEVQVGVGAVRATGRSPCNCISF